MQKTYLGRVVIWEFKSNLIDQLLVRESPASDAQRKQRLVNSDLLQIFDLAHQSHSDWHGNRTMQQKCLVY